MSVLTIAQNVANETGFESPSFLIGNADPTAVQLLGLIKRETRSISDMFEWQALRIRGTFDFVDGQEAYPLPDDFKDYIPKTMWNFTSRRPIITPINAEDYEIQKNYLITSGIDKMAYIYDNQIFITPVPGEADTINFEYMTLNLYKTDLGIGIPDITADTDSPIVREYLVELGVKLRFLVAKGIDHTFELVDYDRQVMKAIETDGFKQKILNMNSGGLSYWTAAYTQDSNYPA